MTKVFAVFINYDYINHLGKLFHKREDAEKCLKHLEHIKREYYFFVDTEDGEFCNEFYNKLSEIEQISTFADIIFIEEVEIE